MGKRAVRLVIVAALILAPLSNHAAEHQQRVLVIGDSMMRAVSRSLQRALSEDDGIQPVYLVCLGSGLARLDLFDWHAKIGEMVEQHNPALALVFIGANDDQPMRTEDGILQPGTEVWTAEYQRRVSVAMDLLLKGGVKRLYWIGLPDMRDAKLQRAAQAINAGVRGLAEDRPSVHVVDTATMFSREAGTYSGYITRDNGMPLHVRDTKGVHLNRDGADILVNTLLPTLKRDLAAMNGDPAP